MYTCILILVCVNLIRFSIHAGVILGTLFDIIDRFLKFFM